MSSRALGVVFVTLLAAPTAAWAQDAGAVPTAFAAALRAIPTATAVHVRHGWNGLNPSAPLDNQFDFTRAGPVFHGSAVCRIAGREHPLRHLSMAARAVDGWLSRLATIPVREGAYQARITHTDDYPDVTIELETSAGRVTLHSRSQGRDASPWEITLGSGAHGVVESPIPAQAMAGLIAGMGARQCGTWMNTVSPARPHANGLRSDEF